ncbi:hypothetical protein J3L16_05120 [Alteromonas sp. 5E99-2]|uniref:hypothetical protein n=1 Tax=Alteromonas sp. 5E99-2 TaxID=2817683 RepID=UPI001A97EB83|nr:hypothetical protein [Alteromonas sp. 5E99-2]MBO1255070.1 hypothetical protein [Alteromonas sp. 5E99-2]
MSSPIFTTTDPITQKFEAGEHTQISQLVYLKTSQERIQDRVKPKPSTLSVSNIITIIIGLFTLSIPMIYTTGYYFRAGYLTEYNVYSDLFPVTNYDILMNTYNWALSGTIDIFSKTLEHLKWFSFWFALLFFILAVIAYITNEITLKKQLNTETKKKADHSVKINLVKQSKAPIQKLKECTVISFLFGLFGATLPFITLFIYFILIVFPYKGYEAGKEQAIKEKSEAVDCLHGQSNQQDCMFIYKENANKERKFILQGKIIAASTTSIAVFSEKKTIIYPLAGLEIEYVPASTENIKEEEQ